MAEQIEELEKLQERQKMTNELRLQQSGEIEARQLAVEKQLAVAIKRTEAVADLYSDAFERMVTSPKVSCHDIAAIWVVFFSRCQRYRCGQAGGDDGHDEAAEDAAGSRPRDSDEEAEIPSQEKAAAAVSWSAESDPGDNQTPLQH